MGAVRRGLIYPFLLDYSVAAALRTGECCLINLYEERATVDNLDRDLDL